MKLFFSPGACSLSPHIVLLEAGLPFTLDKVDLKAKTTAGGQDYRAINAKAYVPALQLDNGVVLTEVAAIVQYLADQVPGKNLAPANGGIARYQLQACLNFIGSEIHKSYTPLFDPSANEDVKERARASLLKRYAYLNDQLSGSDYLLGNQFSVADVYLFVVTTWAGFLKFDLSAFPQVLAFQKRIGARPAVQQALRAEGLID
jgi:glutathione S-transferase